ncbi:MAG: DUF4962 domain-containing protein [Opitutaceae bacterium]
MKESRHPHPHIDPRKPRHQSTPGTNPPVFAWKPPTAEREMLISGTHPPVYEKVAVSIADGYTLQVATDEAFTQCVIEKNGLEDPVFLPERALPPGTYWWKWSAGDAVAEIFTFTISASAVILEVPAVEAWLQRFPDTHPRMHIIADSISDWRKDLPVTAADKLALLTEDADALLAQSQHMDEPEFLPDRTVDYAAFRRIWYPTMWGTRQFAKGAETLALAYLATGNQAYGRAACDRILSLCQWDPEGSSYLGHNDEAHMSVITTGPITCDWVWDLFTDEERLQVINQFRRRGELTFSHMHDQGCYGVTRFDSHAGREIVFLAQLALVFHEQIPDARRWLEWLRPVLCGIWPVWAGDDGGWAEGISYSNPYVTLMSRFASILKQGAGIDLYTRPFWKNHIRWKQAVLPAYAEWIGFGDHTERWEVAWTAHADLVELIARETQSPEFLPYVAELRREARLCAKTPPERVMGRVNPTLLLAPTLADQPTAASRSEPPARLSHVFPAVGWAAIRTGVNRGKDDVAFIFRSSPFGSFSHSHANNNDFILHVGGRVMAMPTGYYAGYGSAHHAHWVWHTKSNNCLTFSDASQLIRSLEARGAVEGHFENDHLVYFQGDGDQSYRLQARRCRRHVVYLKASGCFLLVDEFIAQPGVTSALQWNIHSWNPFAVSKDGKAFTITREESVLAGHFLFHQDSFITMREGWDPPPAKGAQSSAQWHNQYHLRFSPTAITAVRRNFGVVLCPGYPGKPAATVSSRRTGNAEIAEIGPDAVAVNQADEMEAFAITTKAIALVQTGGTTYAISVQGIAAVAP